MDDTTIITDADYGFVIGSAPNAGVITGTSILNRHNQWATIGTVFAASASPPRRVYVDVNGNLHYEGDEAPEPPKPEAKPKKTGFRPECFQEAAFDADRAWQATIAACKGVR